MSIVLRIIEVASRQRHCETARDAQLAAKSVQNILNARNSMGQSSLMLAWVGDMFCMFFSASV